MIDPVKHRSILMSDLKYRLSPEKRAEARRQTEQEISDYIGRGGQNSKYLQDTPKPFQSLVYKQITGGKSPTKAIKLKCLDCCSWQKEEVKSCGSWDCPLHDYRPYKKKV